MFFNPGNISNSGQGIQGPRGPKGDKGDAGPQGPKGEKGDKGDSGVMPADMVDYMGNQHESLKAKNDADIDWLLGEINTIHYEGQNITATETIEECSKSAILKGNTLVNYLLPINKINWSAELTHNGEVKDNQIIMRKVNGNVNSDIRAEKMNMLLQPDTSYLLIYEVIENIGGVSGVNMNDWSSSNSWRLTELNVGVHKIKITTNSKVGKGHFQFYGCDSTENNAQIIFSNLVLIPYQEGMENWDIPYFEGMQSVKMPVLTTTGKNLYDTNKLVNDEISGYKFPLREFKVGEEVVISVKEPKWIKISTHSSGASTLQSTNIIKLTFTMSESLKDKYIMVNNNDFTLIDDVEWLKNNVQVEYGTSVTSYEPYKSNILTVNGDVTLRGIGDVQDTLDLMTGELTQRVGEIVLDGSDIAYTSNDNYMTEVSTAVLTSPLSNCKFYKSIICENLPVYDGNKSIWMNYSDVVLGVSTVSSAWGFCIRLPHTLTGVSTVDSEDTVKQKFKAYLQSNPITIQYQLETESVKTVDLSDNHVYSYKGTTHYDCSSAEGSLVPTLSIDVPTKLNALVSRHKDIIQELTQENENLKTAQQVLLNSQLSFYETLISSTPAFAPAEGQVDIPDFIQDLYRLKNNLK